MPDLTQASSVLRIIRYLDLVTKLWNLTLTLKR